jgi:hypothetical protein
VIQRRRCHCITADVCGVRGMIPQHVGRLSVVAVRRTVAKEYICAGASHPSRYCRCRLAARRPARVRRSEVALSGAIVATRTRVARGVAKAARGLHLRRREDAGASIRRANTGCCLEVRGADTQSVTTPARARNSGVCQSAVQWLSVAAADCIARTGLAAAAASWSTSMAASCARRRSSRRDGPLEGRAGLHGDPRQPFGGSIRGCDAHPAGAAAS